MVFPILIGFVIFAVFMKFSKWYAVEKAIEIKSELEESM